MYCYKKGEFTQDFTMSQMIEFCLQFLDQWAVQTECKLSPVQAKEQMLQYFPYLKRWKEKDERTLTEKATHLLAQCENVTIASIDADGYPRPVQMSKIHAKSFNEVWMVTSVGSMKVNDLRRTTRRGFAMTITGMALPAWYGRNYYGRYYPQGHMAGLVHSSFPDGPSDPNYVLLHFIGTEATFWINGEFSHSNI